MAMLAKTQRTFNRKRLPIRKISRKTGLARYPVARCVMRASCVTLYLIDVVSRDRAPFSERK